MELEEYQRKTYYQLLGVDHLASLEQIKHAYRELARVYHPDSKFFADIINEPPKPKDIELFKLITSAYSTLSNESARAKYDEELALKLKEFNPIHPTNFGRAMKQAHGRPIKSTGFGATTAQDWSNRTAFSSEEESRKVQPMSAMFHRRRDKLEMPLLIFSFGVLAIISLAVVVWLLFGG